MQARRLVFSGTDLAGDAVRAGEIAGQPSVRFSLSSGENTRIGIYDTSGRHVRTLANGFTEAGNHTVPWQGDDERGNPVAAGVYILKLDAGGHSKMQKVVVLR